MKAAFFRNAILFTLQGHFCRELNTDEGMYGLSQKLEVRRFQEGTGGATGIGFVPPSSFTDDLIHFVDEFVLLTLRVEKKVLPSSVVKREAAKRLKALEQQQGYKPGRKMTKEVTELVRDEMLAKAPSVFRDTRALIDFGKRLLLIETPNRTTADAFINTLARCLDPFPVETLYVAQSPASAMTEWLAEDEAPANFTIDQDAELRSSGVTKAAIRYIKHSIDADDVRRHIQSGKQCTRLAMTWADRVSFVLTEGLDLKSIKPLDVLNENVNETDEDALDRFNSDLTLFGRESRRLVTDLIYALGGLKFDDAEGL
jgi:recombination associated protein RdgC